VYVVISSNNGAVIVFVALAISVVLFEAYNFAVIVQSQPLKASILAVTLASLQVLRALKDCQKYAFAQAVFVISVKVEVSVLVANVYPQI
jgi:hypothetical protein